MLIDAAWMRPASQRFTGMRSSTRASPARKAYWTCNVEQRMERSRREVQEESERRKGVEAERPSWQHVTEARWLGEWKA
jgi:hypothetical protein